MSSLVMVIEIDAGLRGIVIAVLEVEHLALAGDHRIALGAVRSHVHVGKAAAVHVVAPSHWLAAVAPPHRKSLRKAIHQSFRTLLS